MQRWTFMLILLKLSKDWRGGNTPKDILWSHHHPDTQIRERHHQKRNLQSNILNMELLWWLRSKESTCQYRKHGFNLWVRKMLWRRKWHPTPVFLPRKSCGQRSLVGYSSWGPEELDITEWLSKHAVEELDTVSSHWQKKNNCSYQKITPFEMGG